MNRILCGGIFRARATVTHRRTYRSRGEWSVSRPLSSTDTIPEPDGLFPEQSISHSDGKQQTRPRSTCRTNDRCNTVHKWDAPPLPHGCHSRDEKLTSFAIAARSLIAQTAGGRVLKGNTLVGCFEGGNVFRWYVRTTPKVASESL